MVNLIEVGCRIVPLQVLLLLDHGKLSRLDSGRSCLMQAQMPEITPSDFLSFHACIP
jgi:hypothetical protein